MQLSYRLSGPALLTKLATLASNFWVSPSSLLTIKDEHSNGQTLNHGFGMGVQKQMMSRSLFYSLCWSLEGEPLWNTAKSDSPLFLLLPELLHQNESVHFSAGKGKILHPPGYQLCLRCLDVVVFRGYSWTPAGEGIQDAVDSLKPAERRSRD